MTMIKFNAPKHYRFEHEDLILKGGQAAEVPQERAEQLISDPNNKITEVDDSEEQKEAAAESPVAKPLADLNRDQLDDLAEEQGLNPSDYATKEDLIAAIQENDNAGEVS